MNRLLPATAIALAAFWASAQEDDRASRTVDSGNGPVIVLPLLDAAGADSMVVDDVRIEMSIEGEFRVYRARQAGHTRTVYEPVDGPSKRYAYDPAKRRFDQVTSTLRVRLNDYERLAEVVASVGALRGKSYPALGFALLRLTPRDNPAVAVQALSENPLVASAEVVLKEPIRVPQ